MLTRMERAQAFWDALTQRLRVEVGTIMPGDQFERLIRLAWGSTAPNTVRESVIALHDQNLAQAVWIEKDGIFFEAGGRQRDGLFYVILPHPENEIDPENLREAIVAAIEDDYDRGSIRGPLHLQA